MIPSRRDVLLHGLLALIIPACGAPPPRRAPTPPRSLGITSMVDQFPAAGLEWLVQADVRALLEDPSLSGALMRLAPLERQESFAKAHGGLAPSLIEELVIASYGAGTMVYAARAPLDPGRVEQTFRERATHIEARALDQPDPPVLRLFGELRGERAQLAILNNEAVVLEVGRFGPLRAICAFALKKLKRATPALRLETLAELEAALGKAPLRALALGPFANDAARGLGGVLSAATSAGLALSPERPEAGIGARVRLRLAVTGAFGDDAPRVAQRLESAVNVLRNEPLMRLCGLHEPLGAPLLQSTGRRVVHEASFDADRLARGIKDATESSVPELLNLPGR